ncbi:hypothetical protein [Kitasatospora sp. GP82]|uniref:hypothetical protein n=1 Tax=Kitasatospora sp. GP82 TaxID=3035089 RepID=UPI0024754D82|nr:hypothetical protein [Kitasatospora sp. GP82]
MSIRHRSRGRRRAVALSLGLGAVLTAGAALLGVSFAATTPAAQPNPNCSLTVPADPLTAQGLATPYKLTATNPAQGTCHESDPNQSAFVQATVLDPASGAVSVYNPLVIDQGTTPAIAPVLPTLPTNAVVGIWFGYNGNTLSLLGQTRAGRCIGGTPKGQAFGQFAYCNAPAFFTAANTAERAGKLTVPPLGIGRDGKACPTTRDFGLVDQDQSDNVTAEYLATARGRTAQKTAKNSAAMGSGRRMRNTTALLNGSDNLLLVDFVDPALGCTPWTAPNLADPGSKVTSLALNELQAAKFQTAPIALVPLNDPMVAENNKQSLRKANLYRAGVDQPTISAAANGDPKAYCADLATVGAQRINLDQPFTAKAPSPAAGQSLFDFLTQRLAASLTSLGCRQAPPPPTPSTSTVPTATPSTSTVPTATPSTSTVPTATPSTTAMPTATPSTSTVPTATPSTTAMPTATPSTTAMPTIPAEPSTSPPACCTQ